MAERSLKIPASEETTARLLKRQVGSAAHKGFPECSVTACTTTTEHAVPCPVFLDATINKRGSHHHYDHLSPHYNHHYRHLELK